MFNVKINKKSKKIQSKALISELSIQMPCNVKIFVL